MYQAQPRRGLLPELDSQAPLQADFIAPVANGLRQIDAVLEDVIHSIYLSGDVAQRTAENSADLEFTLVTNRVLNVQEYSSLNTIRWRVEQSGEAVKSVSFNVVPLKEITNFANIFRWGFFLKHCAICLKGDNLADSFGHFEVSWEVSKAMNDDLQPRLKELRQKIALATKWGTQLDAAEEVAKRLIRASFGLVAHKTHAWEENVERCSAAFLEHYPDKSLEIERLFYLIQRKPVKKRAVVALMDAFGAWVSEEYAKTDRKIG
ncbi:hypothetical protein [Enterovibrio nigricans]|uniref:Nucleotidyltransferase domain-containing protein n=1 Tax=Enterovibrio nigricans DSM 22720 TaxID=1121868 RepID=A0A1T4UQY1_9GAMM|nr:hypothetical protein [Enterovibrio nigricans]PKF50663.1 hypothetical protein AT251_09755 [Enterovibrio nigricans]SKA55046.1 hypothetical protein SAMN02745132_02257 [Enterovibrio nigricans DSM 22720]